MNWLDSLVAWVDPNAGMRRVRARAALELLDIYQKRVYDGAKATRRTSGWTTAGTSANAEALPSVTALRSRSRDLVRNNPYARRAIAGLTANSIGTGIEARWSKKQPNDLWKLWCAEADYFGEIDFYGIQSLVERTVFESGAAIVRRVHPRSGEWKVAPLKLQVLEPDYLDNTKIGPIGDNFLIGGIEIDKTGRRVGYWMWSNHPGDVTPILSPLTSTRIDASEVLYVYEKDRPGQLLGVPRLAVSLMKLRDLDDYEDAELVRKKIAACFTAFVTTSAEGSTLSDNTVVDTTQTTQPRLETIAPGMVKYLRQDEEVTFGNPPTDQGYGDYTATQLRAIAVGVGVTYEQLTGDLSRVNFSSMRVGKQDFKQLIDQHRWLCFIPMFCQRVAAWWLEAGYMAGKLRTVDYTATWTPPRWEYHDPLSDVKADKEDLSAGLSSLSEKLRARGYDPEEVFAEIAKERAELKKMGITLSFGITGVDPAADAGQEAQTLAEGGAGGAGGTAADPQKKGLEQLAFAVAESMRSSGEVMANALATVSRVAEAASKHPPAPEPAPLTIENHVHMAEQRAGDVKVDVGAPIVKVEPRIEVQPATQDHPARAEQTVERDGNGDILKTVTRYHFDQEK